MSSQNDGLLQTNQSYHYNRERTGDYNSQSIDSAKFSQWQKDHMYKSSYAHFHSKVHLHKMLGFNITQSFFHP